MSYETESLELSSVGFKKSFRIQRNEYPEHFAGFGEHGPKWSSDVKDCAAILTNDLLWIMVSLSDKAEVSARLRK